jgi:hypothetical protein
MKQGDHVRDVDGRIARIIWMDPLPTDDIAIEYRDGNVVETKQSEVKPLNFDRLVSGRMSPSD